MKIAIYFLLNFLSLSLFSQTFTESDIKKMAEQVNEQMQGVDIGNDIKIKGSFSIGRTLIFQYDVPSDWEAPDNFKEEIISELKISDAAKTYSSQNIDVDFYYFKEGSLVKKITIKSNEFSTLDFSLGEYISIENHPKAKGVNLKVKAPIGWEISEGNRPNIVKTFTSNGTSFGILILENMTFFSRNQIKELLGDDDYLENFMNEAMSSIQNPEIINQSVITIDTYPAIQFKIKGNMERAGLKISMILKSTIVFYEDKIIFLQSNILDNAESRAFDQLYFLIINSVIFPDQYR